MISPCIATPHEGEIASCGNTTVEQVVASYIVQRDGLTFSEGYKYANNLSTNQFAKKLNKNINLE